MLKNSSLKKVGPTSLKVSQYRFSRYYIQTQVPKHNKYRNSFKLFSFQWSSNKYQQIKRREKLIKIRSNFEMFDTIPTKVYPAL